MDKEYLNKYWNEIVQTIFVDFIWILRSEANICDKDKEFCASVLIKEFLLENRRRV